MMYSRKRLCPYQDNFDNIGRGEQYACHQLLKKPCVESQRNQPLFQNEDMEIENKFNSNAEARLQTEITSTQYTSTEKGSDWSVPTECWSHNNNNNNGPTQPEDMHITSSEVCHRCQAGESGMNAKKLSFIGSEITELAETFQGHFGHIGR